MTRISDSTTREILLETGLGDLAVMAEFDIEGEEYEAEPYSWGGSRGTEAAASAELLSVTINALKLDRAQVVAMTSEDHVRGFEEEASERFLEVAA